MVHILAQMSGLLMDKMEQLLHQNVFQVTMVSSVSHVQLASTRTITLIPIARRAKISHTMHTIRRWVNLN